MDDGRGMVVEQFVVQMLEALDYAWLHHQLMPSSGSSPINPSTARQTSLVLVIPQDSLSNTNIVLLHGADVIVVHCKAVSPPSPSLPHPFTQPSKTSMAHHSRS